MDDFVAAHDVTPERLTDGLVAEADAEERRAGFRRGMPAGFMPIASCTVSASLRRTTTSVPSSPR
jgi:hypothetical protein